MSRSLASFNKRLVLDAFDTLFNRRDYAAAEKYGSPDYIQHSVAVVRIENGLLKEHWDVLQDEATRQESLSGLLMFGDRCGLPLNQKLGDNRERS